MITKLKIYSTPYTRISGAVFVIVFAAIGVHLLFASHAATPNSVSLIATYQPACNPAPPGYATCFLLVRNDAAALSHRPNKPTAHSVNQAEVTPGNCNGPGSYLGNCGAYDPSNLQAAYNLTTDSANNGFGKTIAIDDAWDDPSAESDLAAYRSEFNLPPCTTANGCFQKLNQTGIAGSYPQVVGSYSDETALDLDMASAICPNCRILLIESTNNFVGNAGIAENTGAVLGANAISNSYGYEEGPAPSNLTAYNAYYNHPGIAITASSGDAGYGIAAYGDSPSYGVEYPAVLSSVTAVGGTSLNQADGTTTRSATETAWSGAGSGCSLTQSKPSWQTDAGCTNRTIADVSADADTNTPVWFYWEGSWEEAGGTSVSAPIIAATTALTNSSSYSPSTPYSNPSSFNDITSGSNGTCSVTYLCNAIPGYDGPTGLGTPNGIAGFETNPSAVVPTVIIKSPLTATDEVSGNFSVSGTATDTGSTISSVSYSIDGGTAQPATGTTSWSFSLNPASYSVGYHTIAVIATDTSGNSTTEKIGVGTGDTIPPNAPASVTAVPVSPTQINVSWAPSTDNVAVTGYDVYRDATLIATVSGTTNSYDDTAVSPSTTYEYGVVALDAAGNMSTESRSSTVTSLSSPDTTAPSIPTSVAAGLTAGNDVNITWGASTDNTGGSGLAGYYIIRNGSTLPASIGASATSYEDTAVTPGVTYKYQVEAYDNIGNVSNASPISPAATVTIPPTNTSPPTKPNNLAATAVSYDQVNLSWKISKGSPAATGYYVYRNKKLLQTVTNTSYLDSSVSASTTYTYYVVAFNVAGKSPASAKVSVTTEAAPTTVTVVGVVTSTSSGLPLDNVHVYTDAKATVEGADSTYTNSSGQYVLSNLLVGQHSYHFVLSGYTTQKHTWDFSTVNTYTKNISLAQ